MNLPRRNSMARKIGSADDTDGLLRPKFNLDELARLHLWCLNYQNLVQADGTPTADQDKRFLEFSAICYATGVFDVKP